MTTEQYECSSNKPESEIPFHTTKLIHNINRMMAIESWEKGQTDSGTFEVILEDWGIKR